MDDVYADVMKTTGATKDEVLAMNEEFKKTDTRTTREEMNKMAEELGRMGVPVANLTQATIAADKAAVALGDTFQGGASEVANTLGLLNSLYAETRAMEIDRSFMSIGSAMNELAANGVSSEQNIANFTKRVGSMPEALKPAIADALGLGAAFEESGIEAERASRAYSIVLSRASTNTGAFASVMKRSTGEVKALINENPVEFFLQFSQAMRGMSATDTAKTLKDLKINADGASSIIGAAANNTDRFRELLDLSNKSFREATSLTNEFNIKNNTLGAQMDKAKAAFHETALELGASLNPILLKSVNGTTYLIKALVELPKWLKENKGLITTLALVMGVYTISVNKARIANLAHIAVEKLRVFQSKAVQVATLAQIAVTDLFTGKITLATRALKAMFATMGVNPVVAIGVALAAVTFGLYKLYENSKKVSISQKTLSDVSKSVNTELERETINLEAYRKRLLQTEPNSKERIKLVKELNEHYPDLLKNIDAENASVDTLDSTMKTYLSNLYNTIRQKVLYGKISEKIGELENESNVNRRHEIKRQIELLKSQYEYQMLVNEYGEENAKLISSKSSLESEKNSLEVLIQMSKVSFDNFANSWRELNSIRGIIFSSTQEETDALNKAYNDNVNMGVEAEEHLKEIGKSLEQINKIVNRPTNTTNKGRKGTGNENTDESESEKELQKILSDTNLRIAIETKSYNERLQAAELYGIEIKELTDEQLQQRLQIDRDYQQRLTQIAIDGENRRFEEAKKNAGLDGNIAKLTSEQLQAIELLQAQHEVNLQNIKDEGTKKLSNIQKHADERVIQELKRIQKKELDALEISEEDQLAILERQRKRGIIDEQTYNRRKAQITANFIEARLLAEKVLQEGLILLQSKGSEVVEDDLKNLKDRFEDLDEKLKQANTEANQPDDRSARERVAEMDIPDHSVDLVNAFATAFDNIQKLRELDLGHWTDYGVAIGEIMNASLGAVASIMRQTHEIETHSLEAEKQKQLSIAGNNAQERERIEREYAQKELDLKKKQANADAGIKIAQTVAAGALAIIQGFAQLGPIGGAISAVLIGITTGLQVASIIKQRNAIMNTTLEGSGGGDSAPKTGKIVLNQAAEGRYDVIGKEDGKTYRNVPVAAQPVTGIVENPTIISEQGRELIVSAPDLRRLQRHINYPLMVDAINDARHNRIPQRAAGNYSQITDTGRQAESFSSSRENDVLMTEVRDALRELKSGIYFTVRAVVALTDIKAAQELESRSTAPFSK